MTRGEDLRLARRIDWRFLLPAPALGRVIVFPGGRVAPDEDLVAALRRWSGSVRVEGHLHAQVVKLNGRTAQADSPAPGQGYDLAVVADPGPEVLREAARAVRPGGAIYMERRRPPGSLARPRDTLDRRWWSEVQTYWCVPTCARAEEIVPLDDGGAMHLALERRRIGALSRPKAALLALAISVGAHERLLAEVAVVGIRTSAPA